MIESVPFILAVSVLHQFFGYTPVGISNISHFLEVFRLQHLDFFCDRINLFIAAVKNKKAGIVTGQIDSCDSCLFLSQSLIINQRDIQFSHPLQGSFT